MREALALGGQQQALLEGQRIHLRSRERSPPVSWLNLWQWCMASITVDMEVRMLPVCYCIFSCKSESEAILTALSHGLGKPDLFGL